MHAMHRMRSVRKAQRATLRGAYIDAGDVVVATGRLGRVGLTDKKSGRAALVILA